MNNVKLNISKKSFKRFNRREPANLVKVGIDLSTPLIKIGELPEIIYISSKEGSRRAYRHKTKKPFPVLYAHPKNKMMVILGGRIEVKNWLFN